jgi:4-amino-4-deoxy-L-arabinose transferase-like glycosyltransferase
MYRGASSGISVLRNDTARTTFPFAVIVILLAAGFLRFWNIGWGLPDIFEEATPFARAWGIWRWGSPGLDFNPHFFNYPGLTFLIHWVAQVLHFGAGWVFGTYANLEGFRAAYDADPTRFIVTARCLNATFDIGTVFLVTLMANRLAGGIAALIAGGLSACNPLQIQLAQQINVDTPMAFFVAACLWFCLDIQENRARHSYVYAGICAGLALSCKYTAAPLVFVIVAAHCTRMFGGRGLWRSLFYPDLLLALAVTCSVFLLLNPWIVLDPAAFKRGISYEALHLETGHFGIAQDSSSPAYYLADALPTSIGWTVMGSALIGACTCWYRRDSTWVPVLVWILIFSSVLFVARLRADRYILPLVPALLVLSAGGVLNTAEVIGGRRYRVTTVLLGLLGVAVLGESATRALAYHRDASATDTRTLAREWLARNFPGESFLVMAPLGVAVTPPRQALVLPYVAIGFDRFAPFYDARWFVDLDLVIGSDFDRVRYTNDPGRYAPFLQFFYDSLETRWRLMGNLGPGSRTRGPRIWFYSPPGGPSTPLFSEDLMQRLDSVPAPRALINFGWNLSGILYYRGKPAKADQLWRRITGIVLRLGDPFSSLEVMSDYPEEIRSDPRFRRFMEALAEKETNKRP